MEMAAPMPRRSMLPLVVLVVLFGLPPLLGWLYFLNPQWLPDKHSNNGQLIHPAQPLAELALKKSDGSMMDASAFSDAWRLTVVVPDRCEKDCLHLIENLYQVRRAVGGNQKRIKTLLLLLPGASLPAETDVSSPERVDEVVQLAADDQQLLESIIPIERYPRQHLSFVIDPMGALMMSHDHRNLSTKELLRDMEKLLKISQNWVKGTQYGHN